ncbi:hypothetical protein BKA70DRAFT_1396886 [Coprinopsis sp. MPI-PUGE-AT-0042]|nr:hypothetical protein BKA70DRAFT_1396886 [Coprinopsis sp. MPI-PUGE-AT-0042]
MASECKTMGEILGNDPGVPRSDLVGLSDPLSPSEAASHPSPLPSPRPPAVPARSPLRPPARSVSSQSSGTNSRSSRALSLETPPPSTLGDPTFIVIKSMDASIESPMEQQDPFPLIDELLEAMNMNGAEGAFPQSAKLSPRADSPNTAPLAVDARMRLPLKSESSLSTTSESVPTTSHRSMSKREYALQELLSSERAYASDLSLIQQVYIPLAQGQAFPLSNAPLSPPNSSASSSRTMSTASDSSTASLGPPMTPEDTKIIFSNVVELLTLSEALCQVLEGALGSLLEGGTGQDYVGEVFFDFIPRLERPYQYYITRHPTALQHLQNLPSTPALQNYLAYTRTVASSVSHAWDLASLLIKPVQRLLKYPLLLSAIIEETPDSHPDKHNLKEAKLRTEAIARNVNEIRRRSEVVKEVLTSKKKSLNVTVAASVNLGKMKNLRPGSMKNLQNDSNGEAGRVENLSAELKQIEDFAQDFAKNIVDWSRSMTKVMSGLRTWALGFGKVIGLSDEQRSEAFEAFVHVIEVELKDLSDTLDQEINITLLRHIALLLDTMRQPHKLLSSMREQEPFHYHLLTMNVSSKNRPPAALLAASTNYLALRGQLDTELPMYIAMLRKGIDLCIAKLAEIQVLFWGSVRDKWAELWEMLRVEGELNAGHEETMNVWRARWMDVDEVVSHLNINQRKKIYQEPERARSPYLPERAKASTNNLHSMLSSLEPEHKTSKRQAYSSSRHASMDRSDSSSLSSGFVTIPVPSHPMPQRRRSFSRRESNDNPLGQHDRGKSPRRKSDREGYSQRQQHPPYPNGYDQVAESSAIPRWKSMPLSNEGLTRDPSRRATSPPRIYAVHDDDHGAQIYHPYSAPVEGFDPRQIREHERPSMTRDDSSRKAHKGESAKTKKSSSGRSRSGSVSSLFKSEKQTREAPPVPTQQLDTGMFSRTRRDSLVNKPARYVTTVIMPCMFKRGIDYYGFPFFDLFTGDFYEVLQEAGHPSIHKLPVYVDEGEEDCLLLCRDRDGMVGWAFASFMEPVDMPRR